ncbi:MAG: response regulator [Deltaproteobacteria bacterium]|nr:response regulator [Deltaproteobacteria bacterium]
MAEKFEILLVDDDEVLLRVMREALEGEGGYVIDIARDGRDAVGKFKEKRHDLVVTDLRLPGIDGMELLKEIRGVDRDTVLIMITAYGTLNVAIEALEKGAYDFMEKPFKIDDFVALIRNTRDRLPRKRQQGG